MKTGIQVNFIIDSRWSLSRIQYGTGMTLSVYINQESLDSAPEPEIKKKRSKASFVVFFVNLFLMAAAFFVIKNQNEEKSNNQEDNNFGNAEAPAAELTAVENKTALTDENNQTEELNLTENNVGTGITQPIAVSKNTGVSVTSPLANIVPPAQKPSKKTKTS